MSTWRMWCVDGNDRRLSTEDTDILFTWEWVDRWTLQAVLPRDLDMRIDRDGVLTHFHCEHLEHPGRPLMVSLDWDRPVRQADHVHTNDMTVRLDEGVILLMEEYLPQRPAA